MLVEQTHEERNDNTDDQIDGSDEQNDLYGAAGLVDNGVAYGKQLGIAYSDAQSGVFDQIQKLARCRRNSDAIGLRQDDPAHDRPLLQAERVGGFDLSFGNRHNTGAYDLCDKRGMVQYQAAHNCREFGGNDIAALIEPPRNAWQRQSRRPFRETESKSGNQDQQQARCPEHGIGPTPGGDLDGQTGFVQPDRDADARRQHKEPDRPGSAQIEPGNCRTAVAEVNQLQPVDALLDLRKRQENGKVQEEYLHQERNVANHLDITAGQLPKKPVVRHARDSDQRAYDSREDDADSRNLQRVHQADQQCPAKAIRRRISDQLIRNHKGSGRFQKVEAQRQADAVQALQRIHNEECAKRRDDQHKRQLQQPGNRFLVAPYWNFVRTAHSCFTSNKSGLSSEYPMDRPDRRIS